MPTFRPKHHITPKKGWINDPNGFAYFQGRYHIYCQYNPYDTKWGPMHWLHFASDDLLHFEELSEVMKPDQPYDHEFGCFSGSAIEKDGKLYVLYTGAVAEHQRQCLAISEDGQTFTKYEGNPIIDEKNLPEGYLIKDFRDPKVFEKDGMYYVLLACRHEGGYSSILLYRSLDLFHYEFVSVVKSFPYCQKGGMVECPDILFEGDKCALLYSLQHPKVEGVDFQNDFTIAYTVGSFDLEKGVFTPLGQEHELDKGFDAYATQTLSKDGKNYLVDWQSCWGVNYPSASEGYVGQLSLIKEAHIEGDRLKLSFLPGTKTARYRVKVEENQASLCLNNLEIRFDKKNSRVTLLRLGMEEEVIDEEKNPVDTRFFTLSFLEEVEIECSYDHSCVELRFQGGEAFASLLNYQRKYEEDISIKTNGCRIIDD